MAFPNSNSRPRLKELFDQQPDVCVGRNLEISSAYNRLNPVEGRRNLSDFVTYKGLFWFTRVYIDLASATFPYKRTADWAVM